MSAFANAVDALFADPNIATDAVWRTGGADPGMPVRVIVRQPDRIGNFGETRIAATTLVIDVRVSEVAAPAEGDTIEMNGAVSVIQGAPMRDAGRLIWTLDTRPAP
jgi:hypothetical protein